MSGYLYIQKSSLEDEVRSLKERIMQKENNDPYFIELLGVENVSSLKSPATPLNNAHPAGFFTGIVPEGFKG